MNSSSLVLSNEEAAKLFVAAGYNVLPEEVLPVKLERMAFRKTCTELRIACWKVDTPKKAVFLRMDTGDILERPKYSACIGLDPSEGLIFADGTIVSMTYFSPIERRFKFEKAYLERIKYHKIVVPSDGQYD